MWDVLATLMPVVAAVGAQVVLLALPVGLRNWRDDWLWALTYVGFQVFVGSLLHLTLSKTNATAVLGESVLLPAILFSVAAACLRVVQVIPMEGTTVSSVAAVPVQKIDFGSLFLEVEARAKGELPEFSLREARRKLLHERLVKRKPDKH